MHVFQEISDFGSFVSANGKLVTRRRGKKLHTKTQVTHVVQSIPLKSIGTKNALVCLKDAEVAF